MWSGAKLSQLLEFRLKLTCCVMRNHSLSVAEIIVFITSLYLTIPENFPKESVNTKKLISSVLNSLNASGIDELIFKAIEFPYFGTLASEQKIRVIYYFY